VFPRSTSHTAGPFARASRRWGRRRSLRRHPGTDPGTSGIDPSSWGNSDSRPKVRTRGGSCTPQRLVGASRRADPNCIGPLAGEQPTTLGTVAPAALRCGCGLDELGRRGQGGTDPCREDVPPPDSRGDSRSNGLSVHDRPSREGRWPSASCAASGSASEPSTNAVTTHGERLHISPLGRGEHGDAARGVAHSAASSAPGTVGAYPGNDRGGHGKVMAKPDHVGLRRLRVGLTAIGAPPSRTGSTLPTPTASRRGGVVSGASKR
jgi:hypothetical protein